jgi:hypothetical protein
MQPKPSKVYKGPLSLIIKIFLHKTEIAKDRAMITEMSPSVWYYLQDQLICDCLVLRSFSFLITRNGTTLSPISLTQNSSLGTSSI